jgi:hypothetical protein
MTLEEANKSHAEVLDAIVLLFKKDVIARDTFKDLLSNANDRYRDDVDEVCTRA